MSRCLEMYGNLKAASNKASVIWRGDIVGSREKSLWNSFAGTPEMGLFGRGCFLPWRNKVLCYSEVQAKCIAFAILNSLITALDK